MGLSGKIESLEETIATLKTLIFGVRSERAAVICAEQLALNLGSEAPAAPPRRRRPTTTTRPRPGP